jgi:hypothetical protein
LREVKHIAGRLQDRRTHTMRRSALVAPAHQARQWGGHAYCVV